MNKLNNVKTYLDLKTFKKTGEVIETYQIVAGYNLKYRFRSDAFSTSANNSVILPAVFSKDDLNSCIVYVPSLKKSEDIEPEIVYEALVAMLNYQYFYNKFFDKEEYGTNA